MIEVAVNRVYGSFTLNKATTEALGLNRSLGFIWAGDLGLTTIEQLRSDPRLIEAIREHMTKTGENRYGGIEIVTIPFHSAEGWVVEEHDGKEWIAEEHMTW